MKRILLFLDFEAMPHLSAELPDEVLKTRVRDAIKATANVDTAWVHLVLEPPSCADRTTLLYLRELTEHLDWVHIVEPTETARKLRRLEKIREFGAEAIGFVSGLELLPKEAAYRWCQIREKVQELLDTEGVVLASLPAATIISPKRILANVHYSTVISTTVAFFKPNSIDELLSTCRADWFSKFTSVSSSDADKVLAAFLVDDQIEALKHFKGAVELTDERLSEVTAYFEADEELIRSWIARDNPIV